MANQIYPKVMRTPKIGDTYTYYVIFKKNHGYFTVYNRAVDEKVVSVLIINGVNILHGNSKIFPTIKSAKMACVAQYNKG